MKIIESINKARERGLTDKEILEEIEKQNPEKKPFFDKARERGFSSAEILDEIIRQNVVNLNKRKKKEKEMLGNSKEEKIYRNPLQEEKKGKTVLNEEIQKKEEEMREKFLQKIEEKAKNN